MLNPILDRWRLSALIASAAMLATAHAFQTFGGYQPCTLCLRQREVYWVAAGVALAALVIVRTPQGARLKALSNALLALIFLIGAGVAAYHAGAEWKFWPGPTACSSGGVGVSAGAMAALVGGEHIRAARCDEAAWVFAGLSMAGWNVLASLGLSGLSVMAALRERRA
jgi:disulfide bond formation protein DsbB